MTDHPRLNVGCGPVQPDGWLNLDPDEQWSAGVWPPDRWLEAEGAVAHHVLQMVAWPDLVRWLDVVRLSLEPGAWLRVSVPDFPGAYAAALDGDSDWFPIADELEPSIDGKLVCYLTQCGATRSLFTGPLLCDLFRRAGFVEVHETGHARTSGPVWLTQLDSRPAESIYVEGRRL